MMVLTRVVQILMVTTAVWGLWYAWTLPTRERFADVDRLARARR
jgi:hypothetical protein